MLQDPQMEVTGGKQSIDYHENRILLSCCVT